jgi:hypothetical protein
MKLKVNAFKQILLVTTLISASIASADSGTLEAFFKCEMDTSSITKITLSPNSLSCNERKFLAKDLERLKAMQFKDPSPELQKALELKEVSGASLLAWLEDRVQYIYNDQRKNSGFKTTTTPVTFENSTMPFLRLGYDPGFKTGVARIQGILAAENSGAGAYAEGKAIGKAQVFFSPEGKQILVTSPRTGLISVQGLFTVGFYPNAENNMAMINSIHRLGVLFHEARHSDGSGRDMMFGHSTCPKDNAYAGQMACDDTLNGSYTVGALVIKEMLKNCSECTPEEIDTEKALLANHFYRVLEESINIPQFASWYEKDCQEKQTLLTKGGDMSELGGKDIVAALVADCPAQLDFMRNPRKSPWVDPSPEKLKVSDEK